MQLVGFCVIVLDFPGRNIVNEFHWVLEVCAINPDVQISTGPVTPEMLKTAADSLLPIVQSQRERFRMRATELEAVHFLLKYSHKLK